MLVLLPGRKESYKQASGSVMEVTSLSCCSAGKNLTTAQADLVHHQT